MDNHAKKVWVRLGGLSLHLSLLPWCSQKLWILAAYYTIAAGTRFRGKVLPRHYTLQPGWIIGWHRNGADPARRVYYHVQSLYDLERLLGHARNSEEVAHGQVAVAVEVAIELIRDWLAFGKLKDEQRAQLTQLLAELYLRFELARNPALRDATGRIAAAATLQDRLGRVNLGATSARVVAARRRYEVRLEEILRIAPQISRLHVCVAQEVQRISRIFLERDYSLLREARRGLLRVQTEQHLRSLTRTLQIVRSDLATIWLAPFYRNARYMEVELRTALQVLADSRQTPSARAQAIAPLLETMVYSIAFKRAQRVLESLIKSFSIALRDHACGEAERRKLLAQLEKFAEQFPKLKENGFRRERIPEVGKHLQRAMGQLRKGKLRKAKATLKVASALL